MWHLFKSRCSVIWREEVRNSTASMEPQNVSYWCVQICNRFKYAHLSLILSEMRMICEAKLYSTLSTHSLAPCRSPLCPKDWGLGWGRGGSPTDGVQWLQHVRGGTRRQRELWSVGSPSLISHHNRCSAAALTYNRLTDGGRVSQSVTRRLRVTGRGASEQTDIYGRWQFANISICAKALGVTMRIAMKLEESAASIYFIRPFFPPRGAIAWQREVTERVKTPTRTHSAWIRDFNEKVFSKRQKNKLKSFSKIRSNHSLEEITHICIYQRCDVYLRRSCDADDNQGINQDINVTKVWRRHNIIGEWCCLNPPNWVHFSNFAERN